MADLKTPFLQLTKPTVGDPAGEDLWGEKLNANFDTLDANASTQQAGLADKIPDAPNDGQGYLRRLMSWFPLSSFQIAWEAITGKPTTFPDDNAVKLGAEALERTVNYDPLITGVSLPDSLWSPMFSFGESSNYCTFSESFDQAIWVKTNVATTAINVLGPPGDLIAERMTGSVAGAQLSQLITNSTVGFWTFSVWARMQTGTGTIGLAIDTSAVTDTPTSIDIDTTWRRVRITRNITAAHTTKTVDIVIDAQAVELWGAQLDNSALLRGHLVTSSGATGIARNAYVRGTLIAGTLQGNGNFGTLAANSGATLTRNTINSVPTDAASFQNQAAATVGVPVQISPRIRFLANAWRTNATAASQSIHASMEVIPVSGPEISGSLRLGWSVNNGAYTYPISWDSFGKTQLPAGSAITAPLNIPHGGAPTAPVDGDIWTSTSGLFVRTNGGSHQAAFVAAAQGWSAKQTWYTSTAANASFRIPPGVAPTAPLDGDVWGTATGLFYRISGGTLQHAFLNYGAAWTTKQSFQASTTAASSIRLQPGVDPTTPVQGDMWFVGGAFKYFDGTTTQTLHGDAPSDATAYIRKNAGWDSLTSDDVAGLDSYLAARLPLAGGTMTGTINLAGSTTVPPIRFTTGGAPTTPLDGHVWMTTNYMTIRLGGASNSLAYRSADSAFSAKQTFTPATTGQASIRLSPGVNPTTPQQGDLWFVGGAFRFYDGTAIQTLAAGFADAASDGKAYGRLNAAWTQVLPANSPQILNGQLYGETSGLGMNLWANATPDHLKGSVIGLRGQSEPGNPSGIDFYTSNGTTNVRTHAQMFKTGDTVFRGDITSFREASPNTGVIYLNQANNRYLFFDGTNYQLNAAALTVGGEVYGSGLLLARADGSNVSNFYVKGNTWAPNQTLVGYAGSFWTSVPQFYIQVDASNGGVVLTNTLLPAYFGMRLVDAGQGATVGNATWAYAPANSLTYATYNSTAGSLIQSGKYVQYSINGGWYTAYG